MLVLFALIALVVSAIVVYGVSAYAIEARRREFGIRMAISAPRSEILSLVLRDAVRVAAFGAVVGVPAALLLASRIRDILYDAPRFGSADRRRRTLRAAGGRDGRFARASTAGHVDQPRTDNENQVSGKPYRIDAVLM